MNKQKETSYIGLSWFSIASHDTRSGHKGGGLFYQSRERHGAPSLETPVSTDHLQWCLYSPALLLPQQCRPYREIISFVFVWTASYNEAAACDQRRILLLSSTQLVHHRLTDHHHSVAQCSQRTNKVDSLQIACAYFLFDVVAATSIDHDRAKVTENCSAEEVIDVV